jgi:hypothetical protein
MKLHIDHSIYECTYKRLIAVVLGFRVGRFHDFHYIRHFYIPLVIPV